jgi:hypothetical protein
MIISPYIFKGKALRALKGNWQTALLVSFFAALPMTAAQLFQATQLPSVAALATPRRFRRPSPPCQPPLGLFSGCSALFRWC